VNNLLIGSGAALTTSGLPPYPAGIELAVLGSATVEPGGRLSLDAAGYNSLAGPGAGRFVSGLGSGGGYGGPGGASATAPGGAVYGLADSPTEAGSGGGGIPGTSIPGAGSQGGGVLRLTVGNTLKVDGAISADGNAGLGENYGGGAGGSLWLTANRLEGTGRISAAGGDGELFGGGGGGGGRIVVAFRTNAFAGVLSAQGGGGYLAGGDGTIYVSPAPELRVLSQSPTGTVANAVSSILLSFSSAVALETFTPEDVELVTPWGPMPASNITVSASGTLKAAVSFPPQTAPGDYVLRAGPDIRDLAGLTMSQVYTGAFTITLPVVQGSVLDTNGAPVPDVLMQASGSGSPFFTDPNGLYSVGAPPGTAFGITPVKAGWSFVPGTRYYTNATDNLAGQDFLAVTSLAPNMALGAQGTNLVLTCLGIPGVSYQLNTSSNLVDWVPLGDWTVGTNGPLGWVVPVTTDPAQFFRLKAQN
jgi:hypothetical protein